MNKKHTIKIDLKRIDAKRDEDIDYSDIPEVDEDFFKTAKIMVPPGKKQLTLCLGGCFGLDETTGQGLPEPYQRYPSILL